MTMATVGAPVGVQSLYVDRNNNIRQCGHSIAFTTRINCVNYVLENESAVTRAEAYADAATRFCISSRSVQRFTLAYIRARDGLDDDHVYLAMLSLLPLPPSGKGRSAETKRVDVFLKSVCAKYPLLDLFEYQDALLHCMGKYLSTATLCRYFQRLVCGNALGDLQRLRNPHSQL